MFRSPQLFVDCPQRIADSLVNSYGVSMSQKELLQQMSAGYEQFNAWEAEEQARILPQLTIEEGINQYIELWELSRVFAPNAKDEFLAENVKHWTAMRRKYERILKKMNLANPIRNLK